MTLRLTRLDAQVPIVNPDGTPSQQFLRLYNGSVSALETAFNGLEDAVAAIAAAQAAADAANTAAAAANTAAENAQNTADAISEADALAKSFVVNFTPPLVEADDAGNVTIADHERQYAGEPLPDPVPVDGDTVATGEASGTRVYIFYSDPTRAGGAVTYQFSTVEADAAQIGDTHNIGAVDIPVAGTSEGGYVRPPGWGGATP